jgi:nucleoside-diphosphate-sugar epimerase
LPALADADDVFTNHIHADDLAAACIAALRHGRGNRAYNVVDDSDLKMAEYFDRVAAAFDLSRRRACHAARPNNACRRCRCPSCANRGASATGA